MGLFKAWLTAGTIVLADDASKKWAD